MIDNTLAEAILRYVSEHKISHLMDISDEFAVKQGYGSTDVKMTVDVLLEKGLLALMQGRKQSVRVTDSGNWWPYCTFNRMVITNISISNSIMT